MHTGSADQIPSNLGSSVLHANILSNLDIDFATRGRCNNVLYMRGVPEEDEPMT